jgi:hypothetical protein
MTLDFTEDGKVKVCMHDYVDGMLAELPADITRRSCSIYRNVRDPMFKLQQHF